MRKIGIPLHTRLLLYIKVGFKGVYITRTCFRDVKLHFTYLIKARHRSADTWHFIHEGSCTDIIQCSKNSYIEKVKSSCTCHQTFFFHMHVRCPKFNITEILKMTLTGGNGKIHVHGRMWFMVI